MKLPVLTLHLLLCGTVLLSPPCASAAAPAEHKTIAEVTRSMARQGGFMDLWRDTEQGRVLLSVPQQSEQFLMVFSLPHGLRSNDIGLDRGMTRGPKLVQFERRGKRIFLIEHNTGYRATSVNPNERASVSEAFAGAVLWSGDIIASEGDKLLVDFSSFLISDWLNVAGSLATSKQGAYKVDDKRSAVLAEQAKSFPDNTAVGG